MGLQEQWISILFGGRRSQPKQVLYDKRTWLLNFPNAFAKIEIEARSAGGTVVSSITVMSLSPWRKANLTPSRPFCKLAIYSVFEPHISDWSHHHAWTFVFWLQYHTSPSTRNVFSISGKWDPAKAEGTNVSNRSTHARYPPQTFCKDSWVFLAAGSNLALKCETTWYTLMLKSVTNSNGTIPMRIQLRNSPSFPIFWGNWCPIPFHPHHQ